MGRGKHGSVSGPAGRRASNVGADDSSSEIYGKPGTTTQLEKV